MTSSSYLSKSIVVSSSVSVASSSSVSIASTTSNSKFYDNSHKNFSIKELPESVSPLSVSNISFSNISEEIGPIPPPRMFSDAVISTIQAADADVNGRANGDQIKTNESDFSKVRGLTQSEINERLERTRQLVEPLKAQITNMHLNKVNQYMNGHNYYVDEFYPNYEYEDEWSSPLVEEVAAKEPQLSAIPKKSALKKPKNQNVCIPSNTNGSSDSKPCHMLQGSITNGYVCLNIWTATTLTLFYFTVLFSQK